MTWLLRLVLLIFLLKRGVMAEFLVTVDTNRIIIRWKATDVSTNTNFNISLDFKVKHTGRMTAHEYIFKGLQAGRQYTLIIDTTTGRTTFRPVGSQYTTKPNVARSLTATATATSTLTVTWDAPGSGLVGLYEIQLKNKAGTKRNISENTRQATFGNLMPGTPYTVVVVTVSGDQRSDALEKCIYTKPNVARSLKTTVTALRSLTVMWLAPTGVVGYYTVQLKNKAWTKQRIPKNTRQAKFSNLRPGTPYTVVVVTVSGDQQSGVLEKRFYTKPNPPRNLRATATASALALMWDSPASGLVGEFEIQLTNKDGTKRNTGKDTRQTTFTNLVPFTSYTVMVVTVLGNKRSEALKKDFDTKLGGARSLTATATVSSLRIAWLDPVTGLVGEYEIQLKNETGTIRNIKQNTTQATFSNLTPGALYTFVLVTVSGDKRSEILQKDLYTKPNIATSLRATDTTATSLTVTWIAPVSGHMGHYEILLNTATGTIKNITTNAIRRIFTNLMPGTLHTVVVVTVSGDQRSEALEKRIYTKPSVAKSLRVNVTVSSLTVTWDAPAGLVGLYEIQLKNKARSQRNITKNTRRATFSNLMPGSPYTVIVVSVSGDQRSETLEKRFYTKPNVARSLRATATATASLTVTWDEPASGRVGKYEIQLKSNTGTRQSRSTNTSQTFANLTPGTPYTVVVVTVSGGQQSEALEKRFFTIPSAVKELDVDEVGEHSFVLKWVKPDGVYTNISITYGPRGQSEVTTINVGKYTEKQINGVESGTEYGVIVYSLSGPHTSAGSSINITTEPSTVPEIKVKERSTTLLKISWKQPAGNLLYYVVKLLPINGGKIQSILVSRGSTLEHTFTNLMPGHEYNISITVWASSSRGSEAYSIQRTNPLAPTDLRVTFTTTTSVMIQWQYDSNASYFIKWHMVYREIYSTQENDVTIKDKSMREINISKLTPGQTYSVDVYAVTTGDIRSQPLAQVNVTVEPLPVTGLWAVAKDSSNVRLNWTCTDDSIQDSYQLRYHGQHQSTDWSIMLVTSCEATVSGLLPGDQVTFEVKAVSKDKTSAEETTGTVLYPLPPMQLKVDKDMTTTSSVTLKWEYDERKSHSEMWRIVHTMKGESKMTVTDTDQLQQTIAGLTPGQNYSVFVYGVTTSDIVSQSAALVEATVKPEIKIDLREDSRTDTESVVIVYTNETGEGLFDQYVFTIDDQYSTTIARTRHDERVVRFGSLVSGHMYKITAQTGSGNERSREIHINVHTASASKLAAALGGSLGSVTVVVGVGVLVFFLLKRRSVFVHNLYFSGDTFINPLRCSYQEDKVDKSHRCKLDDFPEHWTKKTADSNLLFAADYEELKPIGCEQSKDVAGLPVNKAKNRFTNILPYDKTRIKLMSGGATTEGTDYINGNWIPGYNSKREYAVVQGPLPGTKNDFWRMIWEQKARAIVMLTKCVEKGRDKCNHYWPVDMKPMYYGDLKVEVLSESKSTDWVVTKLEVSMGLKSHTLTHYHYVTWPDFGVPDNTQSLIGFVRLVRRSLDPVGAPVVVHCSAGVGRSGTFVVLDRLLQHIEEHDWVDVYNTVYELRLYRNLMVQTETQYIYIHNCLLCVVEGREDPEYEDTGEDNEGYVEDDEAYVEVNQ